MLEAVSQTPRSMPFCTWKGKGSFYSMIRNLMVSCSRLLRGVYTDQIYCWLCYFTWLSFLSQQYLPVGVLINPLAKPQLPLSRRRFSCKGRNHPLWQKSSLEMTSFRLIQDLLCHGGVDLDCLFDFVVFPLHLRLPNVDSVQ